MDMAAKGVKTFVFCNNRESKVCRVKLYSSGIYSVTDGNGEHECGMWEKKPLLVGRYNTPSKDPNCVIYIAQSFTLPEGRKPWSLTDYKMRDFALKILEWELSVR